MTTRTETSPANPNNPAQPVDLPLRCGVFTAVEAADQAISCLLTAGFRKDQISVVCSDESQERHFRSFHHEDPAGSDTPRAAATGGAIGAMAGGVMSAGITTAAGLSILIAGPSLLLGGAVVGGLIGAMRTRADEGALSDFFDQSLTHGKLLVGVRDDQPGHEERLARAETILQEAGAEPFSLAKQ